MDTSKLKRQYEAPNVVSYGNVEELTAAIGSASQQDQSEYPEEFPPDTGSFDVCNNDGSEICQVIEVTIADGHTVISTIRMGIQL